MKRDKWLRPALCGLLLLGLLGALAAALGQEDPPIAYTYENGVLTIQEGTQALSNWPREVPSPRVVVLPASLSQLSPYHFEWMAEVEEYHVSPQSPYYQAIDGAVFTKDASTLVLFPPARGGSYALPKGTTAIGNSAFEGNQSLTELILPQGMTDVHNVFSQRDYGPEIMPPLTRLVLPQTVTDIGASSLKGRYLREVKIDEGNPLFFDQDGVVFSRDGTLVLYPLGKTADHYGVPQGTKRIGISAFSWNAFLRSVSLPESVTAIEGSAFSLCGYLESVALPLGLEEIGEKAFVDCVHLSRVAVPEGTRLGQDAFSNTLLQPEETEPRIQDTPYTEGPRLYGILSPENARDMVQLLEKPEKGAAVLAHYPSGTTVSLLGQKDGYTHLYVQELRKETAQEGYVPMEQIQVCDYLYGLFAPRVGLVPKGAGAAVRYSGLWVLPEQEEPRRTVAEGKTVLIQGQRGQFYEVRVGWEYDYIPVNQLTVYALELPEDKRYGVVINDDLRDRLHVRAAPSKGGASLGKFFSGTQVEILGEEGDWYRVKAGFLEGYMLKTFVQPVEVWKGNDR